MSGQSSEKRVSSLEGVKQDLEADEQEENAEMVQMEQQIVSLVKKRDALKRAKAQRARDVAFISAEVAQLRQRSKGRAVADATGAVQAKTVAAATGATSAEAEAAALDATSSSADAAVATAEAERLALVASTGTEEVVGTGSGGKQPAALAAKAAADAQAKATAEAQAKAVAQAEAKIEAEMRAKLQAESAARAAAEAMAKAANDALMAEQRRQSDKQAEERAKADKAEQAREVAKQEAESEEVRKAQEAQRHKEDMADHADDSFKEFMKQEDGEDEQGDADYEESANALASATGWDQHEIESKANSAVKQLTEAIGGKKVVRSLQGMMAGVR